ncbi:hypothetical protein NE609_07685 [Anaerotruncus sp. DFI.9.16]|nr:hypothetical protein [Anaerotruncus sp. DFI.9.16]MCQ4895777.1 hypothetical protein [Anaerotruncus sp. DFI.9.16]
MDTWEAADPRRVTNPATRERSSERVSLGVSSSATSTTGPSGSPSPESPPPPPSAESSRRDTSRISAARSRMLGSPSASNSAARVSPARRTAVSAAAPPSSCR